MTAATGKSPSSELSVEDRPGGLLAVRFSAMASPCELLLAASDRATAEKLGALVAEEAWRIEARYSRYRPDSVVADIHRHRGTVVTLDAETAGLLDFAQQCYE
jgi:thiamine biosynthesis lipoprotein